METPLNAREFLKRFHLPQLVRISLPTHQLEPTTTINESNRCQLVARAGGERSDDWTYKPANVSNGSTSNKTAFRSLVNIELQEEEEARRDFHSIADWSSRQVPPRASLGNVAIDDNAEDKRNKEVRGESIRLMPPSKRPAQAKLELKQPFLLYKAYKKLELCAYPIDPNNELNDKSGDPIYFPQNYPGESSSSSCTSIDCVAVVEFSARNESGAIAHYTVVSVRIRRESEPISVHWLETSELSLID